MKKIVVKCIRSCTKQEQRDYAKKKFGDNVTIKFGLNFTDFVIDGRVVETKMFGDLIEVEVDE